MKKVLLVMFILISTLAGEVDFYEKYNLSEKELDIIIEESAIKTDKQLYEKAKKLDKGRAVMGFGSAN